MVNYRRNRALSPDAIYFLTLCTHNRFKQFQTREQFGRLARAMQSCEVLYKVQFNAWIFLPDHLHVLLKPYDSDYSQVNRQFKRSVSTGHLSSNRTSRDKLWQDRFWEHTIRDEDDLRHCIEYIHWNAVKHGLVAWPEEWPYSSYHSFVTAGLYPQAWRPSIEPRAAGAEWD